MIISSFDKIVFNDVSERDVEDIQLFLEHKRQESSSELFESVEFSLESQFDWLNSKQQLTVKFSSSLPVKFYRELINRGHNKFWELSYESKSWMQLYENDIAELFHRIVHVDEMDGNLVFIVNNDTDINFKKVIYDIKNNYFKESSK